MTLFLNKLSIIKDYSSEICLTTILWLSTLTCIHVFVIKTGTFKVVKETNKCAILNGKINKNNVVHENDLYKENINYNLYAFYLYIYIGIYLIIIYYFVNLLNSIAYNFVFNNAEKMLSGSITIFIKKFPYFILSNFLLYGMNHILISQKKNVEFTQVKYFIYNAFCCTFIILIKNYK